jgi:hypothetical protein
MFAIVPGLTGNPVTPRSVVTKVGGYWMPAFADMTKEME